MKPMQGILVASLLLAPALATAGMRCGQKLVLKGDTFDKVTRTCGEPDATYSLGEKYLYRSVNNSTEEVGVAESVQVHMWVYRGTENELVRNLYFENGVLVKTELEGQ